MIIGFIAGSLGVVWPWKEKNYEVNAMGNKIMDANGREIITGYDRYFPSQFSAETIWAIVFVVIGAIIVLSLDWYDNYKKSKHV